MSATSTAPRVLSAGVIVVRFAGRQPGYLCLRAYNYWDFPKGEVCSDENPLAAARREVEEETGLTDLQFRWGYDYRETPPYRGGKVARYYMAESRTGDVFLPVSDELGAAEHHEFRWFDYAGARAHLADRVKPILDWADTRVDPGGSESGE